jgi:anaerobic selenocysteine-containing dehydrogenase
MVCKPAMVRRAALGGAFYEKVFCVSGYNIIKDLFDAHDAILLGITVDSIPTPTGKVELRLSTAEKFRLKPLPEFTGFPEPDDPEYPLLVISVKSRYYLHSSYRRLKKLREKRPDPTVEIHPDTAARYGISDADNVVIETKDGAITQQARVTDKIHPRVINASIGRWFPERDPARQYDWQTSNFNMLTSIGKLSKGFGPPNLKSLPCRIRRR